MLEQIKRWWCGLSGHEPLTKVSDGRLYTECSNCGYESPGWDVPTRLRAAHPIKTRITIERRKYA